MREESEHLKVLNIWKALEPEITEKANLAQEALSETSAEISIIEENIKKLQLRLKTTLSAIKKNKSGIVECAVCKSSLSETSKDAIKTHYQDEIDFLTKEKENKLELHLKQAAKKTKMLEGKRKVTDSIEKFSRDLNATRSNLISIERSLSSAKEALTDAEGQFNSELLASLRKDLHNLGIVKKALENSLKINNAWKQAMSKNGLRLSYIKEEVSTLSALASKYASAVYGQPMLVKFYINDDKDTPALDFSINGKSATMKSTGERGRLEIAMTLSLLSLLKTAGNNLEFLILDEILDGLSESSKKSVLSVIESVSREYQVLMISHDPLIKNKPGHIIQVCKDTTTNSSTVKVFER
jgi:DNA repair ATPase RecN